MNDAYPARESKRAQRERDFGGSIFCALARFKLLDATREHPAGAVLYTTDLTRTTYGRRSDGSLGMRFAFCRPVPEHLQFVMGGDVLARDGRTVGWTCPPQLRETRLRIDVWSSDVANGAVQGYYRWSAPECVPTLFAGANLDGHNVTNFRAATTVDLKAGFHLTAEPELPEFAAGITVPDAAA